MPAKKKPTTTKTKKPATKSSSSASRAKTKVASPKSPPPAKASPSTVGPKRSPSRPTLAKALDAVRDVLGIETLRPGQEEGLKHILAGKNVLAVMPTGSGKSLLYQAASLVLPGVTVVVSPLIALITDQVEKMREKGAAVARIDSTLTVKQKREMMALVDAPGGKLLLTTPERMADPEFRKVLCQSAGSVGVSLFVVDEAHCVSQWGHDFRPAYLTLRQALEELGNPPVLATTATAPPHVRDDILHQLGIGDAKVVSTSFERPNLSFEVISAPGEDDKKALLLALVKKLKRPGIIYCATVKAVNDLGEELMRHGLPVATYNGRMNKGERDAQQTRFMEKRSKLVMVATNAFGLGVDKADIRYVLHYHVPGSLEQYAQEAGRGGRDGAPARCVLLFSPDDVLIQEYFLKGTYPTRRQVHAVVDALTAWGNESRPPTLLELAMSSHVGRARTRTILALLKDEEWVVEEKGGRFHLSDPPPSPEAVRDRARDYEKRRVADRRRLDALLEYVRVPGCRNQVILGYLGEKGAPRCGRCDNCMRSAAEARAEADRATALEAVIARQSADDEGEIGAEVDDEELLKPKRSSKKARVISLDGPRMPAPPRPVVVEAEGSDTIDPIDRTAAEIAAEESDDQTEITVLKRKKRVAEPKPRGKRGGAPQPQQQAAQSRGDDHKKGRRRRRRGRGRGQDKRGGQQTRAPLPFSSPVLRLGPDGKPLLAPAAAAPPVAAAAPEVEVRRAAPPAAEGAAPPAAAPPPERTNGDSDAARRVAAPPPPARFSGRGAPAGPIVEYVRRPMKIAAAPVASASPQDSNRRRRRHERPRQFGGGGRPNPQPMTPRPPPPPRPTPPPGSVAPPDVANAVLGPDGLPLERKRRRRRRKKKRKGGMGMPGQPMSPHQQTGAPPPDGAVASNGTPPPSNGAATVPAPPPRPVSFWMPADRPFRPQEAQGGMPGQGGKKKRRRRRRRKNGEHGMGGGQHGQHQNGGQHTSGGNPQPQQGGAPPQGGAVAPGATFAPPPPPPAPVASAEPTPAPAPRPREPVTE